MRKIIWILLTAVIVLAGCSSSAGKKDQAGGSMGAPLSSLTEGQRGLLGKPAPGFQLDSPGGSRVDLSEHRGKVVMLDFWATWCSPCRATMPILHQVAEAFGEQDVILFSINEGESPQQMQSFLDNLEFKPEVLLDPGMEVGMLYLVDGLPYTVILDRSGSIRALHIGFFPNMKKTLQQEVGQLVSEHRIAAQ